MNIAVSLPLISLLLFGGTNNTAPQDQLDQRSGSTSGNATSSQPRHSLTVEVASALAECSYPTTNATRSYFDVYNATHGNGTQQRDLKVNREDKQTDKYKLHSGFNSDRRKYEDREPDSGSDEHSRRSDQNYNSRTNQNGQRDGFDDVSVRNHREFLSQNSYRDRGGPGRNYNPHSSQNEFRYGNDYGEESDRSHRGYLPQSQSYGMNAYPARNYGNFPRRRGMYGRRSDMDENYRGPGDSELEGQSRSTRILRSTYDSRSVALPACTILCVLTRLQVVDEMGFAKETSFVRLVEEYASDRADRVKQTKRITSCFHKLGSGLEDDNCAYAKKMSLCIGLDMSVKNNKKANKTSVDRGIALSEA